MRTLAPWTALLLCLCSAVPAAEGEDKPGAGGPPPALVVTAPVESGEVRVPLTLVGTAQPRYTVAVASEVAGLVEAVEARKGAVVKEGDPLVRLRTAPMALQIEEGRARGGEVEARIEKAKADLQRAERLFTENFVSEEELQAKRADVAALEQQARQIHAAVDLLEDRFARMTVRAPFSGRLAAERTEVGAWLAEGAVVSELTDLSVVHAMVPMPEGEVSGVHLGDVVEVAFDALPGSVFTGKVSAIVPRGDPASRTFPVEVSIPNRDGRILAGMLARATFHRADGDHATLIPKDAFVPRPDGSGYVVRVEGDVAAIVPVQVLSSDGERFAVEGLEKPLAPGDRVVVRGNERLMSGQPLRDAAAP